MKNVHSAAHSASPSVGSRAAEPQAMLKSARLGERSNSCNECNKDRCVLLRHPAAHGNAPRPRRRGGEQLPSSSLVVAHPELPASVSNARAAAPIRRRAHRPIPSSVLGLSAAAEASASNSDISDGNSGRSATRSSKGMPACAFRRSRSICKSKLEIPRSSSTWRIECSQRRRAAAKLPPTSPCLSPGKPGAELVDQLESTHDLRSEPSSAPEPSDVSLCMAIDPDCASALSSKTSARMAMGDAAAEAAADNEAADVADVFARTAGAGGIAQSAAS
mmetsp:Transcript_13449/g.40784  ORF Transcript_13449/g.40784 Transcript_13449/m.40784 type:complete len:276 (-) Transcript_13449:95-922(-)|eukprot:scaffold109133_cov28-Tisochrysis_lutea.AAC.5